VSCPDLPTFAFSYEGPTIEGRPETIRGFRRWVSAPDIDAAWAALAEQIGEAGLDDPEDALGDDWAQLTCGECLRTEMHAADCPALRAELYDQSKSDLVDEVVELREALAALEARVLELEALATEPECERCAGPVDERGSCKADCDDPETTTTKEETK
jgi:hypothetical protein